MTIEPVTGVLLASVLSSSNVRNLFMKIANDRIAEAISLKDIPEADQGLEKLKDSGLVSAAPNNDKYYVTAKGLKVARDLEKLPIS